jgi:methylthioribose-1-phosphate isomerase
LGPGYSVFLHSQSASVQEFFRLLRKKMNIEDLQIYQTESHPLLEGRQQALLLRDMGYRVTLLNEAAASLVIGYCDVVFLGADTVYPASFLNKIGSYPISLLAREVEASVMVLADSRKFLVSSEDRNDCIVEGPSGEIWSGAPEGIKVKNYYFETVPAELVTAFITEKDVIPGDKLEYFSFLRN